MCYVSDESRGYTKNYHLYNFKHFASDSHHLQINTFIQI